jgi:hypothetical protein
MATQGPPSGKPPGGKPGASDSAGQPVRDVELLKVVVTRDGQQVNAQWAIHPQIKHDLKPAELKEVTDLMAKITGIVGMRFAQVLADAEPDKPGTA